MADLSNLEKLNFPQLDELRKDIEDKLDTLENKLKLLKVDMNTPLLTQDGFPRADLDINEVTATRKEIIMLRNDFKTVSARLEQVVFESLKRD